MNAELDAHLASDAAPSSACLLFSLQFYVDRVTLEPVTSSSLTSNPLVLAFQLLQYEIVVFDTALEASEAPAEAAVTRFRHGKSCLFEADPDGLIHELQSEGEAPLTLLLLAMEHGRARLRAFAAVPLSLHVGILDDDVLGSRLRICEWASYSGSWELRDHHNAVVGSVTGALTLSCLGKSLAPHLTQALGVQVNKSQQSSPRVDEAAVEVTAVDGDEVDAKKKQETTPDVGEEVAVEECNKIETKDSSVQCDEDILVEDAVDSTALVSLRDDKCCTVQSINTTAKSSSVESHILYYKDSKTRKGVSSSRRISQRRSSTSNLSVPIAAVKGDLLFPRELPPPLFFKKESRRSNALVSAIVSMSTFTATSEQNA